MTLVMIFGPILCSLIAVRFMRGRVKLDNITIPHKYNCYGNPKYSGYKGRCDENCAVAGHSSVYHSWQGYFLLFGALVAWPIYILCWFVLVERLPRPFKPDLRARTERLRVQNQRDAAELDRIERELAKIGS